MIGDFWSIPFTGFLYFVCTLGGGYYTDITFLNGQFYLFQLPFAQLLSVRSSWLTTGFTIFDVFLMSEFRSFLCLFRGLVRACWGSFKSFFCNSFQWVSKDQDQTNVITLTNHRLRRQSSEPIKTCSRRKARENACERGSIVFFLLIGW